MAQPQFEAIAYEIIEGTPVMVVDKLRKTDKALYSRLHLNDSGDLEFVISLDNSRAGRGRVFFLHPFL